MFSPRFKVTANPCRSFSCPNRNGKHRIVLDKTVEFDGSGDLSVFSKKDAIQIEAKLFDLFGDAKGGKPAERQIRVSTCRGVLILIIHHLFPHVPRVNWGHPTSGSSIARKCRICCGILDAKK